MLDTADEYARQAEAEAKGYPALAQVYATLAIAASIKEKAKDNLHVDDKLVYPELMDEVIHNKEDFQVEDWINNGTKNKPRN